MLLARFLAVLLSLVCYQLFTFMILQIWLLANMSL